MKLEIEELKEVRYLLEIAYETAKKDQNTVRRDNRIQKLKNIWNKINEELE